MDCHRLASWSINCQKMIAKYAYSKVPHLPRLWKHHTQPIQFMLVINDFGLKYVNKKDAEHLLNDPKDHYKVEIDRMSGLYCGITLDWNNKNRNIDISMPGYIIKKLQKYEHI